MQASPLDASHQKQSLDILLRRLITAPIMLKQAGEVLLMAGPSSQHGCAQPQAMPTRQLAHCRVSGSLGHCCEHPEATGLEGLRVQLSRLAFSHPHVRLDVSCMRTCRQEIRGPSASTSDQRPFLVYS